jgi:hypothetical protein
MTDEASGPTRARTSAARGRRFKPQALELADGGRLVLRADGTIEHLDAQGAAIESWAPHQPGWADEAIRFGVHAQAPTVAPHGPVQGTKPPRR